MADDTGGALRILRADLDDLDLMAQVADLRSAVAAVDAPFLHRLTPEQVQGELKVGHDGEGGEHRVAVEGGRVVAHGALLSSTWDNLDGATIRLDVHPDTRRRGVGSAVLAALEARAAELGRTRLDAGAWEGTPGPPFAVHHGYREATRSVFRRQHLAALDRAELGRRYDEVAAVARGYELLRFPGRTPDDLLDAVATVAASINDAPLDDLEREAERYDADRVRGYEDGTAARGRTLYRLVARHLESRRIVALTTVAVERQTPTVGHQHDTTVVPEHRGHRLGVLLKLEMLRWLAEAEPVLETLDTWNAETNEHMGAVNEELGYRPLRRQVVFQK